jgi:hypothetical protein
MVNMEMILSLLEAVLAATDPYRSRMDAADRETWARISAECADIRERLDDEGRTA